MKHVASIQSNYIPWKAYFDITKKVDLFIFYDDVQYTKYDWRNRNKIITRTGPQWLSIPCGTNEKRLICEVSFSWEEVDTWRQVAVDLHRSNATKVWDSCPSLATVGTGIYQYEHGDFWSAFPGLETPADQGYWGKQFNGRNLWGLPQSQS